MPAEECEEPMISFVKRFLGVLVCWWVCWEGPVDAQQGPLVVYIRDSFYKTCAPYLEDVAFPLKIRFVKLSSRLLMGRLRQEKTQTHADLVLGADSCLSPELEDLQVVGSTPPLPFSAFQVPVPWTTPNILPFCYGYVGFLYHADRLSHPPDSLEALLASNLKVVLPHPRTSTVGLVLMDWLRTARPELLHRKEGSFQERILALPPRLSEAFGFFIAGEADLMVGYTTSAEYAAVRRQKYKIRALPLKEAPFHAYTAFVTPKGAPKPGAQKLLKALLAPAFQRKIRKEDALYPVLAALRKEMPFRDREPQAPKALSTFTRAQRQALLRSLDQLCEVSP